jgi:hypothetical protein
MPVAMRTYTTYTPKKKDTSNKERSTSKREREPHMPKDKYMMRMQLGSMKRACTRTLIPSKWQI